MHLLPCISTILNEWVVFSMVNDGGKLVPASLVREYFATGYKKKPCARTTNIILALHYFLWARLLAACCMLINNRRRPHPFQLAVQSQQANDNTVYTNIHISPVKLHELKSHTNVTHSGSVSERSEHKANAQMPVSNMITTNISQK